VVVPSVGEFADPLVDADLLQQIEELGFDSVWFGDHVVVPDYASALMSEDWLEPISRCLIGLGRTSTLRFGTEVLVAPYRNPVLVAKMLATADALSGGRLTPAFGVGYLRGEFEALGSPPYDERGAVTDEYLDVIRTLWASDGPTSFEGTYVSFDDVLFGPRPSQDAMPMWVGGNAHAALRRAARLGTGWHPLFPTAEQYRAARSRILSLRAADPDTADRPFTFSYSCGTTKLLDRPTGPYVTGNWSDLGDVPEDFSYAPPLPTDETGRPHFMGTPDQVGDDIERYVAAGVEHFVLRFATGGPETTPSQMSRQLVDFAREVAPRRDPRPVAATAG
jgi:probable F420-dependent oxidoreductase